MLVVETLIAVAIAMTTAFGGLVADDLISADASCTIAGLPDLWSHHCTSQARLAWFGGSALLLISMMALRHWIINHNGTLYYLRLLPASSADRMRGAMDIARARSLDFRTATGWFGAVGDVLDLRADVGRVSDELERAMNDDDEATGYLFAPNLSFPAALAVGYDVLLRQRTSLVEVPEEPRSSGIPRADTGMRTVYFDDGYDEWSSREWLAHREHPDPDITLTTLDRALVDRHDVRRVWLSLQLASTRPVSEVDAEHPLRDTCDVVVVAGPTETVDGQAHLRPWELPTERWIPGSSSRSIDAKSFASLLEELSGAIEHVLDDYPEAEVLLNADLPRTVQFALGYVISERKDNHIVGKRADLHRPHPDDSPAERAQAEAENAGLSSLSRFWESVTPVLIHRGEAKPTLVHPAQDEETVRAPRIVARRYDRPVFFLETLIAITVALTTAFGGLVAEDLIARDAACTVSTVSDLWSEDCTSPSRLGWFIGTLAVLVLAMAVRAWVKAHNGTLYYLRLLPAESADRMRAAVDVANARSLDFRSATGWFGTDADVVDLRREVDHISDELERAMNDDDDATGYVLAPNLAFPAALAVGYDTLLRERTHLAELPVEARRRRLPGGDTGVRTVYFDDGDDEWTERRWRSRRSQPGAELAMVTLPAGSATAARADRTSVRRVWLSIQLDGGGPVSEVDAGHPLREAADLVVVVGPTTGGPTTGADGAGTGTGAGAGAGAGTTQTLVPWTLPSGRWYPGTSGRQIDRRAFARLVEELSGAVEQVLDDYPEAHVLLAGRMPRSVAFALGYVISQRKDDRIEGKRAALHPARAEDTRAERAQARAENEGLSSLSRFWTSVTPVLEHLGEAKPTIVHAAQRDATVHDLGVTARGPMSEG